VVEDAKQNKPLCFEVVTKPRVYLVSASSEEERKSWVEEIEKQIGIVNVIVESIIMDDLSVLF